MGFPEILYQVVLLKLLVCRLEFLFGQRFCIDFFYFLRFSVILILLLINHQFMFSNWDFIMKKWIAIKAANIYLFFELPLLRVSNLLLLFLVCILHNLIIFNHRNVFTTNVKRINKVIIGRLFKIWSAFDWRELGRKHLRFIHGKAHSIIIRALVKCVGVHTLSFSIFYSFKIQIVVLNYWSSIFFCLFFLCFFIHLLRSLFRLLLFSWRRLLAWSAATTDIATTTIASIVATTITTTTIAITTVSASLATWSIDFDRLLIGL